METTIFTYNGHDISFVASRTSAMLNATQMAKPFSKRVQHFLSTEQTQEFLQALSQSRNLGFADLVTVTKGGNNSGTWMHEDVAIEFARWLSPAFAIWCNDRIKELLKFGITATEPTIDNIINNPDFGIKLLTDLKRERSEKEALQQENAKLQVRSDFVDIVFGTEGLITMSQAAKELQLDKGRNTLFQILREKGVLFKNSNEPKQEYVNKGYFSLKQHAIHHENKPPKIVLQTYVTQKGLAYIAKILNVVILPANKTLVLTK